MCEWAHPDRLDRLSASGAPGNPASPASPASAVEAARIVGKVLVTGGLPRIPRKPAHRDVVLALLCLRMRRRHPYTELELNDYLIEVLEEVNAGVDHVTCRRYLVDFGFLKRDRAGARYLLNPQRLTAVLSADAMESADMLLRNALGKRR